MIISQKELRKNKQKAERVIATLKELYPEAKTVLKYSNTFELLVAVILSAQTTDKLVNKVTEKLFQKYKTVEDYANADLLEFQQDIKSVNFYRNKAKNIIASAHKILVNFGGKVPKTMAEILTLPGVARKTANVVIGTAYDIREGIAVDTHVKRISILLGLTDEEQPLKIEQDLMNVIPREEWTNYNHRIVHYGRDYCPARPHDHANCPLASFYIKK